MSAYEFERHCSRTGTSIDGANMDIRLEFLILAGSYNRLADHATRNSKLDLVYEDAQRA